MVLKGNFICRDRTDPVSGSQKPLGLGYVRAHECQLALVSGMRGRDYRVGAVPEYLDGQTLGEALSHRVQLEDHRASLPSPHQADGVGVHPCHDQGHAPPARRDRVLISALVKLMAGTATWTTALIAAVISLPKICCHLLLFFTTNMGVSLVAPWRQRYATQ